MTSEVCKISRACGARSQLLPSYEDFVRGAGVPRDARVRLFTARTVADHQSPWSSSTSIFWPSLRLWTDSIILFRLSWVLADSADAVGPVVPIFARLKMEDLPAKASSATPVGDSRPERAAAAATVELPVAHSLASSPMRSSDLNKESGEAANSDPEQVRAM